MNKPNKSANPIDALRARRAELLAERSRPDALSVIEEQLAEAQAAIDAAAQAQAQAAAQAHLADLRLRERATAEALVADLDALARSQAAYIPIARELHRCGAQPSAPVPPLQFYAEEFMAEWRRSLLPPSPEELRQREAAREDWHRVMMHELSQAIEIRKMADLDDWPPKTMATLGKHPMYATVRPTREGGDSLIRKVCQEFVDHGLPWPSNPYLPASEPA